MPLDVATLLANISKAKYYAVPDGAFVFAAADVDKNVQLTYTYTLYV